MFLSSDDVPISAQRHNTFLGTWMFQAVLSPAHVKINCVAGMFVEIVSGSPSTQGTSCAAACYIYLICSVRPWIYVYPPAWRSRWSYLKVPQGSVMPALVNKCDISAIVYQVGRFKHEIYLLVLILNVFTTSLQTRGHIFYIVTNVFWGLLCHESTVDSWRLLSAAPDKVLKTFSRFLTPHVLSIDYLIGFGINFFFPFAFSRTLFEAISMNVELPVLCFLLQM